MHDFLELLVTAVLSDCGTVEDITFRARTKEAWRCCSLVLKNGIQSEENFLRILRVLDLNQFEAMFRRWGGGGVGALSDDGRAGGTIAIDGKTVRGSGFGGESAIHMVSVFATELGLAARQKKTAAKSDEITVIPELLEALSIKGIVDPGEWPRCVTIGRIDSIRIVGGQGPISTGATTSARVRSRPSNG